MKTLMAFLLIFFAACLPAKDTGIISGFVTDKNTDDAISGANVSIVSEKYNTTTNKKGFYEFKINR